MPEPLEPRPAPEITVRRAAAAFSLYLALAVVATWPLVLRATDHVTDASAPPATPPLNIWAMATVVQHLPFDPQHLFEGTAFYPYAHSLAFSEHLIVPALMGAPVALATGNWVLAYNVVTLLSLGLGGLGMYLLAREVTGDDLAAFVAGALYAFHTWNINELVRLQILSNEWFPYVLLTLVRFFARPTPRRALLAGMAYAAQSLSCMYWALYLPFLVTAAVLFLQWRHRLEWRALARLAIAFAPALVATALVAIPYVETARDLGFSRPAPPSMPLDRYFDVLPSNLLYGQRLGVARRDQNAAHFLGFAAMALGVVGAATGRQRLRPFLVLLVVAGLLLSLGPEIYVGDRLLGPGPYAVLRRLVPGFRNVRYPERLSIFLVLGLAPLAAIGLARLRPRLGRSGLVLVGAFVLLEHLSLPQPLSFVPSGDEVPAVYRWLRDQKDVNAVAELPASRVWMERADGLPMYLSTVHRKRTVQGFTGYFPPTYNFVKWRLFHFPEADSVRFLGRFGVDTLVVSPVEGRLPSWAAADARWEVKGPFAEGQVVLRLVGAAGQSYAPPPDDWAGFAEVDRGDWQVRASSPGAARAVDGALETSWVGGDAQSPLDLYRVRFAQPVTVARVALYVRSPFGFPMHLVVEGADRGQEWAPLEFDEQAAYDRLFASLLFRPRAAALVLDVAPRTVRLLHLRIARADPFGLPWTLAEVRVYRRR